jgi:hypothetical protein
MNEWGFISQDILWGLGRPPQFLILNQGVAMCETRGKSFLIPTHHSLALATIAHLAVDSNLVYIYIKI